MKTFNAAEPVAERNAAKQVSHQSARLKVFDFHDSADTHAFYAGATQIDCEKQYLFDTSMGEDWLTSDVAVRELTDEQLDKFTITYQDEPEQPTVSFREALQHLIEDNVALPTILACSEY